EGDGDGDTQLRSINPKTAEEVLACGSPLGLVAGSAEEKLNALLSPKVAMVEGGHGKVSYSDVLLEGSSVTEDFPEFVVKDGVAEVKIPKSCTEIVAKLMEDLEAMSGETSLARATVPVGVVAQTKPLETTLNRSEWSLVSCQNSGLVIFSPRAQEDSICVSLNGFQALQDSREECEFVEDEEDEEDEVEETMEYSKSEAIAHGEGVVVDGSKYFLKQAGNISAQQGQRIETADSKLEGSGTCSISASEGSKAKPKSFLPEALMSSIFAWNMRGFNKPRKQRYWVRAAKLSFGCLQETRVKEENFKKIFDATFPGWSCLNNYSNHRLCRIWVCWSDDVEVCPVSVSAQMITV
ncbi:LOW QUALITY PROTEIN: hypothetical protein HID58_069515, partial [Brassica napus]